VTDAVGTNQRDDRHVALRQPFGVRGGRGRSVDRVQSGSVLEDVQQCRDVLFDARIEQLLDDVVAAQLRDAVGQQLPDVVREFDQPCACGGADCGQLAVDVEALRHRPVVGRATSLAPRFGARSAVRTALPILCRAHGGSMPRRP
jgi:hypothetical protein